MTRYPFALLRFAAVPTIASVAILHLGFDASVEKATPRASTSAMTIGTFERSATVFPLPSSAAPILPSPSQRAMERRAGRSRTVSPSPALPSGTVLKQPLTNPSALKVEPRNLNGAYTIQQAIADCESGSWKANHHAVHHSYDVHAQDPRSSASGKFSFLDGTWHDVTGLPGHAKDYSEAVQDNAFRKLWAGGAGASRWAASRICWEDYR